MIDEHEVVNDKNGEPIILTNDKIQNILTESGISEEITAKIEKSYTEEFGDTPPVVEHLIDTKVLAANATRKKEKELEQKVQILEQRLEETKQDVTLDPDFESDLKSDTDILLETASDLEIESETTTGPNYDVVLRVKPQKVSQIKSQIIDGQKCIVIPMDDNEQANVNGTDTLL